jgi:hypothetical protein
VNALAESLGGKFLVLFSRRTELLRLPILVLVALILLVLLPFSLSLRTPRRNNAKLLPYKPTKMQHEAADLAQQERERYRTTMRSKSRVAAQAKIDEEALQ